VPLLLSPTFFAYYFFLVHHPVNWDDRHILANAMAYDFTVALQFSQREQSFFSLRTKLHTITIYKYYT
jgi:hypothetical protein